MQQSLPQQAQKLPLKQIYPILLDRLVDGALVIEAGRKEHLDQDPAVEDRLKLYEDRLIQQAYIEQLIKGAESEDQLKARYQKFLAGTAGARGGARPPHPGKDRGRSKVDHRPARQRG